MRILVLGTALGTVLWAAPKELQKAEELYRQTRYRDALQAVQPLLARDADALLLAGRAAYGMGDYGKATEYLEKAIQRSPSNSIFHHWLGRAFGRRAETAFPLAAPRYASKARQNFEKAVELNPANGEALNDLFEYYLQAPGFLGGGLDKAEALLPKIKAVDAAEHEFATAKLLEARKDLPGAERHLLRAAEMAPKSVGRALDVASFLARNGRFPESVTWLDRAEKISPKHPQVLFNTARIYIEAKRNLPAARALLQEYLQVQLNPDLPTREEAGKLLKQAGGG
ncbi:MAG: tetratricopeptide repeat protein [Bryobacteraceae bacterium]